MLRNAANDPGGDYAAMLLTVVVQLTAQSKFIHTAHAGSTTFEANRLVLVDEFPTLFGRCWMSHQGQQTAYSFNSPLSVCVPLLAKDVLATRAYTPTPLEQLEILAADPMPPSSLTTPPVTCVNIAWVRLMLTTLFSCIPVCSGLSWSTLVPLSLGDAW